MSERFNDRAQKVMAYANVECHRLGNEQLGTAHLLLGLVREGKSTGAAILEALNVDLAAVALEMERTTPKGAPGQTSKRPQASDTKTVLDAAEKEADGLGDASIGTEHLLLALMIVPDCVACQKLKEMGVTAEAVKREIMRRRQEGAAGGRD